MGIDHDQELGPPLTQAPGTVLWSHFPHSVMTTQVTDLEFHNPTVSGGIDDMRCATEKIPVGIAAISYDTPPEFELRMAWTNYLLSQSS